MSGHLNFKWTVAATDEILRMARGGASTRNIAEAMRRDFHVQASADEIKRICDDSGTFVRTLDAVHGK